MMFEKEAEEIANKRCHEIMCFGHCSFSNPKHHRCGEWHREYNCAKEGIEFGYNKANEWHDLRKDPNDLPIFETELLCQKYSGRCFVGYYHYNDNKFYPYEKGNSYDVTDVIAWKEIVLPKESEKK